MLSAKGIWYPDTGRIKDTAHHQLATCLNPVLSCGDTLKPVRSAFLAEVHARSEPTIVVSSEGFQNIKDLSRIKEFFEPFHVVVVGYLREVLAWKQSAWAQRIHAQCYIDPFVLSAVQYRANYPEFFERWMDAFNDVRFMLFERERLQGGDVVSDFFAQMGHPLSSDEIGTLSRSSQNPSLGGNLLYFKWMMNLAHQGQDKFPSRYSALTQLALTESCWRQNWFVSAEDAERIRRFDKNSNDYLRQRFDGLTEVRTWQYPPMPDTEKLADDFARILDHPEMKNALSPVGLTSALR